MVKHIVFYDHIDGLDDEEKKKNSIEIKSALEGLVGVIPGLSQLMVYIDLLESSDSDIVLYSLFDSNDSLKAYKDHPKHMDVAINTVRPRVKNHRCSDFFVGEA